MAEAARLALPGERLPAVLPAVVSNTMAAVAAYAEAQASPSMAAGVAGPASAGRPDRDHSGRGHLRGRRRTPMPGRDGRSARSQQVRRSAQGKSLNLLPERAVVPRHRDARARSAVTTPGRRQPSCRLGKLGRPGLIAVSEPAAHEQHRALRVSHPAAEQGEQVVGFERDRRSEVIVVRSTSLPGR